MASQYQEESFGGGPPDGLQPRVVLRPMTPMVKRVMIVNVAVYAISLIVSLVVGTEGVLNDSLGLSSGVWRDFFPFLPLWQLGTYGFLHAAEPMHLLWNMLVLYFFGSMVESIVGGSRFLAHYMAAIVVGGSASLLADVASGGSSLVVGASGGVLAMVVAGACFHPNRTVFALVFPIPLKWLATGLVVLDVINGARSWRVGAGGGTAYLVHLAGAAYGFLAVKKRWIWYDPIQRFQVRRAIAGEEQRLSDARRMDELLEKIHREGIHSLTKRERDFLKRVSSKH